MKQILKRTLTLTTVFLLSVTLHAANGVDASKSQVKWTGYGVGKSHWGHVGVKSADVSFKEGNLEKGKIVIDLTTIKTKDIEGEWADKLDGHLKNADFFDVEKFPTATFETTSVKKDGDKYALKGKLTIKGKTESMTLNLSKKDKTLTGKFTFDRSKFDVKYQSKSFFDLEKLGDKLIKDMIDMEITLALK